MTAVDVPHIAGSLWSVSPADRRRQAERAVRDGLGGFHWDLADGSLGPAGGFHAAEAKEIAGDFEVRHEAHLMIAEPARKVGEWTDLCHRIAVHVESPGWREAVEEISHCGVIPAVALNPSTPLDQIPEDVADVLVMSIAAGHAGAPFEVDAPTRARSVARMQDQRTVGWDGGVTSNHFALAARCGVTWLISGGSLFGSPDIGTWLAEARTQYASVADKV